MEEEQCSTSIARGENNRLYVHLLYVHDLSYNDLSTKSLKESYYNYETMDLSSPLPNEMSSSCNNSSNIFHGSSNDFDHSITSIDQVRKLKEENLFLKEKLGEANKKLNTYKQLFVKEHIMLEKERTLNKVDKSRVYRQIHKLKILHQKVEKCKCKKTVSEQLLINDAKCEFYIGIQKITVFEKLSNILSPLVRLRWRGTKKTTTGNVRKLKKQPKLFGPRRKLHCKDEFLLMLMKLRLGVLNKDLADRFGVSVGLVSSIFTSWLKVSSDVLSSMIFIPDQSNISNTRSSRFKSMPDLHSILDGTEFFIQTPKNPDNQKLTWSDYKHHNTLKVLVCVSPNSSIICISPSYGGSISDKEITNRCGYLDQVPSYSQIMHDRGFNLSEECASRFITVSVPPGRRGSAQMTPAEIVKTKKIANMRILVEQVIRRLKLFRILASELPLTLMKCFDDIVVVCAALTNMRKPIFSD